MVDQKTIKPTSNLNFSLMKRATMAAFLPNYHVRSVSLPTRSHPSTVKVEEQLNKFKACEGEDSSSSQAEKICRGLTGLVELYSSIEDLLNLPLTQQALAHQQKEKWVNELVDGSVRYLDLCSETRDTVLLMKESVSELQSAIRRGKGGEFMIEGDVAGYNSSRKKTKKESAKSISSLRQMENRLGASLILDLDQHLSAVVRVLREASLIINSIFQQLLLFLSSPVMKPKPTKWPLVSKLVKKGVVMYEDQGKKMNELERVEVALSNLLVQNPGKDSEAEKIQSTQNRLEDLEKSIEGIENGLGCLFRRLIQTRVSLLNILSH